MWLPFTRANETERIRRRAWVRKNIATLSEQLLAARELFKENVYGGSAFPYVNVTEAEAILVDVMTNYTSNVDQLLWKDRPSRYAALIDRMINVTQESYSRYASSRRIWKCLRKCSNHGRKGLDCRLCRNRLIFGPYA